jgi:hypothetical protein
MVPIGKNTENKMKKIVLAAILLTLAACGKIDQLTAHYTGYAKICVDGVQYIQFTSGATVQYDKDGKVVTCK